MQLKRFEIPSNNYNLIKGYKNAKNAIKMFEISSNIKYQS